MMARRYFARRPLARNQDGATIVEFAIVLPVFATLICGGLDFAHWAYVRSATTGAIESVARSTGVGGASVDPRVYEEQVETMVKKIASTATFEWDKKSYYEFSGIGKPEKLTSDLDEDGVYDTGDCWEDLNPNGTYDVAPGRDGIGGADDIVFYKVTVSYDPLITLTNLLPGVPADRTVVASTIIKRQPHAAQVVPAIRC
jgi:hypothetical protein